MSEEEPKDHRDGTFTVRRGTPVLTIKVSPGWKAPLRLWVFAAIASEPGDEGSHEFVARITGLGSGKELAPPKVMRHTFPRYEDAADVVYLSSGVRVSGIEEAGGRSRVELWIDGSLRTWADVQIK